MPMDPSPFQLAESAYPLIHITPRTQRMLTSQLSLLVLLVPTKLELAARCDLVHKPSRRSIPTRRLRPRRSSSIKRCSTTRTQRQPTLPRLAKSARLFGGGSSRLGKRTGSRAAADRSIDLRVFCAWTPCDRAIGSICASFARGLSAIDRSHWECMHDKHWDLSASGKGRTSTTTTSTY